MFAFDSAMALYRAATRADASFLPAFLDLWQLTRVRGNDLRFIDEMRRRRDVPEPMRRCVIDVVRLANSGAPRWIDHFKALLAQHGATPCVAFGLAKALMLHPLTRAAPSADELRLARVAARAFPEHYLVTAEFLTALGRRSRYAEAADAARRAAENAPHRLHRQMLFFHAAANHLRHGDSAAALALTRRIEAEAAADGRPWVMHQFAGAVLSFVQDLGLDRARYDSDRRRIIRASVERAYDAAWEVTLIGPLIEHGRMNEAVVRLREVAARIDGHDYPDVEMRLRHLEGRALVRSGRPREAIEPLRRSLRAAERLGNVQYIADSHHQMAHAHESLGDWTSAAAAVDRYVAFGQQTADPGARVVSYYDAAAIRWKAGWHAGADSLSRLMVAAIERENLHHAFAAEYFERVGDFGRAMLYLRRAATPMADGHIVDANFLYAGLTRLHLALGSTDSALAAATSHDSLSWTFDELLTPRVLVARGEPARAVEAMRKWTSFQADRGNVRAQIKALVSLGEMLVATAPTEASAVAAEAETLARSHRYTLETIVALRVRGEAATKLRLPVATQILADARRLARAHPDAMQRILIEIADGNAQSAAERWVEARRSYATAITLIERSAGTVRSEGDVTTARFRAARVQAFNGALRSALSADAPSVDSVLQWSARKKRVRATGAVSLNATSLRLRLANDEALIDIIVVDDQPWATVVTRGAATLHRLALSVPEVERQARALMQPMRAVFGGRVDLARAPFNKTAAAQLYDGLLGPLQGRLAGSRHLIISPDVPLHAVAFEALVQPSPDATTRFAIERWTMRYVLSPGGNFAGVNLRPTDRMLLIVGDAPGAQAERDLLRERWPQRTVALQGDNGTETALMQQASSYPILHLATHARSNDSDPLSSYLALKADSVRDGLMHYAEIEAAKHRHALVVLNACETSSGALLPGSGFMSLARAFLVSGTSSVIATQWPVGAASATLSGRFYERVRQGAPLHVALHDAKLALRRDPATAHPFFWASHVLLQGD